MAVSVQFFAILAIVFFMMLALPELYLWKILFAFLLFVPSSAQGLISGTSYSTAGVLNLSMVGYVVLLAAVILFAQHKRLSKRATVILMGCFIVIVIVRIIADGMDFLSNKLLDNYFLPMLLALIMISYIKVEWVPKLFRFIYICIIIGAIIACIEYGLGKSLLFHEYYMETCPWYVNIYHSSKYVAFRSCSLFGHPLIGAIYYILGIVYLLNEENIKKNRCVTAIQFILLVAAILTTNSRSALLGLAVYIVFYLFKNKKFEKLFLLAILAVCLLLIVDWGKIYSTLFARDSSGSSYMVRVKAILSVVKIPIESMLFGEGYNNTFSLLETLGFRGNVEIAYLIILMENGVLGFCAWVISIISLYRKKMIQCSMKGFKAASAVQGMLLSLFIVGGMSNSFGDPGTLNYMIYILLAFSYILSKSTKHKENIIEKMHCRKKGIVFYSKETFVNLL